MRWSGGAGKGKGACSGQEQLTCALRRTHCDFAAPCGVALNRETAKRKRERKREKEEKELQQRITSNENHKPKIADKTGADRSCQVLAKCGPNGGAPSGGAVSLISQLAITWTPLRSAPTYLKRWRVMCSPLNKRFQNAIYEIIKEREEREEKQTQSGSMRR